MHNKRNKRSNKQESTITNVFTKEQYKYITKAFDNIQPWLNSIKSFDTIQPEIPSLSISMFLSFWEGQLMENNGIDNKKIIVNDIMIFLSGFDTKKLHGSKK